MAKLKKYPKAPKAKASLEVWKNHETKIKEVDKYNADLERDKKAKESLIKKVRTMKKK